MSPKLRPGKIIIASGLFRAIRAGEVYIFFHDGKEKIKRVERISGDRVFFIGDNLVFSSDSRQFGWVEKNRIIARIIWPRIHN